MPEILIYDEIGQWGIRAADIIAQIDAARATATAETELVVRIHSPGGEVFEAAPIYTALDRWPGKVTVMVDGLWASIATYIAMPADRIVASESAMMMIHRPWSGAIGDATAFRKEAELLDTIEGQILRGYMRRAKADEAAVSAMVAAETWLTPQQALALGFIDEIGPAPAARLNCFEPARLRARTIPDPARAYVKPATTEDTPMQPEEPTDVLPPADDTEPVEDAAQPDAAPDTGDDETIPDADAERSEELDAAYDAGEAAGRDAGRDEIAAQLEETADDFAEQAAELDGMVDELTEQLSEVTARLADAERAAADAEQRLSRLTSGLAAPPDQTSTVETWAAALKECNGDYALARKKYPSQYRDFMENHPSRK